MTLPAAVPAPEPPRPPALPRHPTPHTLSTPTLHSTQCTGQTLFGVNLLLSSGHLSPYQLHPLTPQADGRLGTASSEFYVQLPLLIAHISYYLKNKKKQQQPVTWVSQCPHHKFPASGPAHHPRLTGKKETQRRQDARTYTVTTSVPGTKGAASN